MRDPEILVVLDMYHKTALQENCPKLLSRQQCPLIKLTFMLLPSCEYTGGLEIMTLKVTRGFLILHLKWALI